MAQAPYPSNELADIHYIYGFCDGNAREAVREYALRFPNRRQPNKHTFTNTHRRFAEGTMFRITDNLGPVGHDVNIDEAVLEAVAERPNISTRHAAAQVGTSQSKVWRVLHREGQHPYHYTPVQELLPADLQLRVDFCRNLMLRDLQDADFLQSIIWTDEAQFTRDGVTNFHNLHEWNTENPHNKKPTAFQIRFSVNVWAGIRGNVLIGPKILPPRLNSENYLAFLNEIVPEMLEDTPIAQRQRLVYQQDGAPAHFGLIVREWLDNNFPGRWIGRNGPIAWPPRSPDLTPLDFYLWGFMKAQVYAVAIDTKEQLLQRIEDAAVLVRENLQQCNIPHEVRKRLRRCVDENGNHIEHLL